MIIGPKNQLAAETRQLEKKFLLLLLLCRPPIETASRLAGRPATEKSWPTSGHNCQMMLAPANWPPTSLRRCYPRFLPPSHLNGQAKSCVLLTCQLPSGKLSSSTRRRQTHSSRSPSSSSSIGSLASSTAFDRCRCRYRYNINICVHTYIFMHSLLKCY